MNERKKLDFGFTLIELLVVITIAALLMSIGMVSYRQAGRNARNGKRKTDLENVRQALILYRADNGVYPDSNDSFDELMTDYLRPDYISLDNIADPKNEVPFVYTYVCSGDQRTFSLTACLEPNTGATCEATQVYTLANP